MKASTEKTTDTTSTTATRAQAGSFFGKAGGGGFFEGTKQNHAPVIQTKLTINEPGDQYEQEADRMADQVVQRLAMPGQEKQAPLFPAAAHSPAPIQMKCDACEHEEQVQRKEEEGPEEQEQMQRKEESASSAPPSDGGEDFSSRLNASKGGGSPLPENTRTDMESAFGTDLSGVRVHTGSEAIGMSKDIHAQAFTHGSDIYFNAGKFDAGSREGKRLLAHELVHVGQQRSMLRRTVQIPPTPTQKSSLPSIEESVEVLKDKLLENNTPLNIYESREDIFRHILIHQYNLDTLKVAFERETSTPLIDAINKSMKGNDAIRALRYLKYGKLRIADKIYFATNRGGYTDEETLYRILPDASTDTVRKSVEEDFKKDYAKFHSKEGALPNNPKKESIIAGLLESELSGWELDKAKALFAYGALRAVDEVRIASNRVGTELNMLWAALERGMAESTDPGIPGQDAIVKMAEKKYGTSSKKPQRDWLEAAYYNSYGTTLSWELDDELSGDDYLKAQIIIGTKIPLERILKATKGPGTNVDKLLEAIKMATPEEKSKMLIDLKDKQTPFYKALQGEIWKSEMNRIEAMLMVGAKEGAETSTAQQYLTAAGASDSSEILAEIKKSCGELFEIYQTAWHDDPYFLADIKEERFFIKKSRMHFDIVTGDAIRYKDKIEYALEHDEDYIFQILNCFVKTEQQRKDISGDETLMESIKSELSTSDFYSVLDHLALKEADPQTMFDQAEAKVKRERTWLGDMTNAAAAKDDELRELRIVLELSKADEEITPEEQILLNQMQQDVDESIEAYITVRNELEDIVTEVVTTAVSIGAALSTGGFSTLANLAMVATATGLAKVATYEIIKGDRFDVIGSDALPIFTGGFVDGLFSKLTAGTAGASNSALRELSEQVGREAAQNLEVSGIRKFFNEAIEEGVGGALSTASETAVDKDTWKNGIGNGMENILEESFISGMKSIGTYTGLQITKKGIKKLSITIYTSSQTNVDPEIKNNPASKLLDSPVITLPTSIPANDAALAAIYDLNGEIIDEAELLLKIRDENILHENSCDIKITNTPSVEVQNALNDLVNSFEKEAAINNSTPVENTELPVDANNAENNIDKNVDKSNSSESQQDARQQNDKNANQQNPQFTEVEEVESTTNESPTPTSSTTTNNTSTTSEKDFSKLTDEELKLNIRDNRDAALALIERYRSYDDKTLKNLAKKGDETALYLMTERNSISGKGKKNKRSKKFRGKGFKVLVDNHSIIIPDKYRYLFEIHHSIELSYFSKDHPEISEFLSDIGYVLDDADNNSIPLLKDKYDDIISPQLLSDFPEIKYWEYASKHKGSHLGKSREYLVEKLGETLEEFNQGSNKGNVDWALKQVNKYASIQRRKLMIGIIKLQN